jgi:hypothetical protein
VPQTFEPVDRAVDHDDVPVGRDVLGQGGDHVRLRADDDDDVARPAQRRKKVKSR